MSEEKILSKIEQQEKKIDAIHKSVEQTRKILLFSAIATIVTFLLPFVALIIMIPWISKTVGGAYNGLL